MIMIFIIAFAIALIGGMLAFTLRKPLSIRLIIWGISFAPLIACNDLESQDYAVYFLALAVLTLALAIWTQLKQSRGT